MKIQLPLKDEVKFAKSLLIIFKPNIYLDFNHMHVKGFFLRNSRVSIFLMYWNFLTYV